MKPPNINPPPSAPPDQTPSNITPQHLPSPAQVAQVSPQQQNQHQQPSTNISVTSTDAVPLQPQQQQALAPTIRVDTNSLNAKNVSTPQPMITTQAIVVLKTTTIAPTLEQQAPLALTTQPQNKTSVQTTSLTIPQIHQQQPTTNVTPTIQANTITLQPQRPIPPSSIKDAANNLSRPTVTPQALITTQANIVTKTSTINSPHLDQQAPLALITQPQSKLATAIPATSSPAVPQLQHQQPQVPVTVTTANIKLEPNKFICCLLDDGVRCDRVAGNASFSARIQKIVASKKMNFALDPNVRHAYICDHHKAVITVAKKSVPTARESKAAGRNLVATAAASNNVNTNTLPPPHLNSYNDIALNQATIQHPVNLELMANQGRLANNHTGMLISMPIRPGTQIAYSHYPTGAHPNQLARVDHPVLATSAAPGFDSTGGGDSIPSSSGGVEVDLQQLQVNTLRRYKRHFRVQTRPGLNKMQLAESLKHHFRTLPIIEKEAITYFVYIVKSSRNKLDHNSKAD